MIHRVPYPVVLPDNFDFATFVQHLPDDMRTAGSLLDAHLRAVGVNIEVLLPEPLPRYQSKIVESDAPNPLHPMLTARQVEYYGKDFYINPVCLIRLPGLGYHFEHQTYVPGESSTALHALMSLEAERWGMPYVLHKHYRLVSNLLYNDPATCAHILRRAKAFFAEVAAALPLPRRLYQSGSLLSESFLVLKGTSAYYAKHLGDVLADVSYEMVDTDSYFFSKRRALLYNSQGDFLSVDNAQSDPDFLRRVVSTYRIRKLKALIN